MTKPESMAKVPHTAGTVAPRPSQLTWAALVLSIAGIVTCLGALVTMLYLEYEKGPVSQSEFANLVNDGSLFLGQVMLYVVGFLVGGTLSVIGWILGIMAMVQDINRISVSATLLAMVGPLAMMIYFMTL